MRKCKIGIVGFGTVGSGIYKILRSEVDSHPILKEIEIAKIAVKDINKKRAIELDNNLLTDDPYKLIKDPSIDVIVEVMGGVDFAREIILESLINLNGSSVNKLLSSSISLFLLRSLTAIFAISISFKIGCESTSELNIL